MRSLAELRSRFARGMTVALLLPIAARAQTHLLIVSGLAMMKLGS